MREYTVEALGQRQGPRPRGVDGELEPPARRLKLVGLYTPSDSIVYGMSNAV